MLPEERRARFAALAKTRGTSLKIISRIIGRSDGYFARYLRERVPYDLAERDYRKLARYFGVDADTMRPAPSAGLTNRTRRLNTVRKVGWVERPDGVAPASLPLGGPHR